MLRGPDYAKIKKLPESRTLWIGARRPFDVTVQDQPAGVDFFLWMEADTGVIRGGTMAARSESDDLLADLLVAAMLTPMPGAKASRPLRVAVESPSAPLRELCASLGIGIVPDADFTLVDTIIEATTAALAGPQVDYLAIVEPHDVKPFIAAANAFRKAAPWKWTTDREPLRIDGLSRDPLFVSILGNAGIERGAVICLNEDVAAQVVRGKRFELEGPPQPLLFFSWAGPDQVGGRMYAQAKEHKWPLKAGDDAPLLLSFQHGEPSGMPDEADMHLATAVLDLLARLKRPRGGSLDLEVALPDGREPHVVWPVALRRPPASGKRLQLRIDLKGTKVHRRIVIAEDATLTELHEVIQGAMGWRGAHLWAFSTKEESWDEEDADDVTLAELELKVGAKLVYEYDFGDGWEHVLKVEKRLDEGEAPACIDGAGACPPDDCGGPHGFASLVEVLAKRRGTRYHEMRERVGDDYDPAHFDVREANERIRQRLSGAFDDEDDEFER